MAQASLGYFGIGKEVTEGVSVAPSAFLPVKDVDFPIDNEFIEIVEIDGDRGSYTNMDGPLRPNVTFTSAVYPHRATGMLLQGTFGSVAHALAAPSATVYKHSFSSAGSLPSFSMERSDTRTLGTGGIFQRIPGCKVETLGLTAAYGEDVEMRVTAQGLDFPEEPASKPASFASSPTMDPFIFSGASVSIDGTPNNLFKSLDMEFTNTLARQETLRGQRTAYRIYEGGLRCTLSGTMAYDDDSIYENLKNSTYFSVTARFSGSTIDAPNSLKYALELRFPKVKVSTIGLPMTAGEVIEADVEFQVSFDKVTRKLVEVDMWDLDNGSGY